jgi:hypothetical protein
MKQFFLCVLALAILDMSFLFMVLSGLVDKEWLLFNLPFSKVSKPIKKMQPFFGVFFGLL